jgi:hypothetical protein
METLYGPPAATLELLLDDPAEHDFMALRRLFEGLSTKQALQKPAGLPYSIATVLAHLMANMKFNRDLIRSAKPTDFQNPYETWPEVTEATWPDLLVEFFAVLEELKQMARAENLERILYPATPTEPAWTVGYKLAASVAKHNAYHLGQIALLRRLVPL